MKTILLIEDNPEIRENTTEILELSGYKVIAADNGREGVEVAMTQKPDMILCDIMMPGLNGYEVIKEIKSDPLTSEIPFIYLTASGERGEVKMAMEMGASGYIRKPYDTKELMSVISKFLEG